MDRVTIEKNQEGIYLSVAKGVELSEVLLALEKERITKFDHDAVEKAIGAPGSKCVIFKGAFDRPASIKVNIPRDYLYAELMIEPPEGKCPWPAIGELKAALEAKNITYGIDDEALSQMIQDEIGDRWVKVANGAPPVDGKDSEIKFEIEFGNTKPLDQGEEGKVDLKELSSLTIVRKGDLLATKTLCTDAQNGINILGKTIKAKKGRDRKLPAGSGTVASDDGKSLYADIDGHLVLRGGTLDVLPIFTVPGDVDYSVGNVHFIGSVDVQGAVRDGFEVKTTGSVTVGGVVEGAVIEADGDLEIKIGVSAGNKGKITAGGSLTAGYIDKATITVGEDLKVKDAIMHSDVSAGKKIIAGAGRGKGQIVGGRIQAGVSVQCVTLGSQMGTKTEVNVGVSPQLSDRRNELASLINENQEKLGQIDSNIGFLKKLDQAGNLDQEKRAILLKLTKGSFQMKSLIGQWAKEMEEIDGKIDRSRSDARVYVKDWCYSGVSISMRGLTYLVREDMRFVSFMYDSGEIKVFPFDR